MSSAAESFPTPQPEEPHVLGVVKPVGKDVDRAEDEFNQHRRLGHLDDSDKVETAADYDTTLAAVVSKLRSGNYTHVKAFGGDGTLNVVTNAVKDIAEKLSSRATHVSPPAIIAGDFGTVGDGRKSTHGRRFLNDLDIANHPRIPFHPMDIELWDGKTLLLKRAAALYSGMAYTAAVAEAADSDYWRRIVRLFPWLGPAWSKPVQGIMAASQLPGTPNFRIFDRQTDELISLYDLSLVNGTRLGGLDIGAGDLRSQSFLELRAGSKAAIVTQAARLAVRNFLHVPIHLHNTEEKSSVEYNLVTVEEDKEMLVHIDGQPEKMPRRGRFVCKSSSVSLELIAPAVVDAA